MLIGIDGGGSKNEYLLFDSDGCILRRMTARGGSVSELGAEAACARLTEQLGTLLEPFGGLNAPIDALFAGLSGGGSTAVRKEIASRIRSVLPFAASVRAAGDTLSALYAAFGTSDGIAVIAGTGSSAFVRSGGQLTTVGGWGHLIDDAGSGFFIGREVLNAVFRAKDGRGAPTLLTESVEKQLGSDARACISDLYASGKRGIAAFAPLMFEAAQQNDSIALSILSRSADELALLIRAAAKLLNSPPYRTALIGSLWKAQPLVEAVRLRLSDDHELFRPAYPAVLGSALCAAEDAALDVGHIRETLIAQLN